MYTAKDLNVFRYFREDLRDYPISAVLDSLTGLVARAYFLAFIQDLISSHTPFALGIVDLDNFKSINDNYGHAAGDVVLSRVAEELINYVGDRGLVGRFGGDEFLIVHFDGNEYDCVHDFFEQMYRTEPPVFRKHLDIGDQSLFITATAGSACYPEDADNYDSLFALIDKTLYRGKFKGRNCYIIYVPEKHAHLEIPKLARRSLYDAMEKMINGFLSENTLREQLCGAFIPMKEYLHLHFLFYVDSDNNILDVESNRHIGKVEDLRPLFNGKIHMLQKPDDLSEKYPALRSVLKSYNEMSALFHSVGDPGSGLGYLIFCPEPRTNHIWQDEECAAALLLSHLLCQSMEK